MHWYKRDPDAALAGMSELTLQERGAYNTILDLLYARDGDLPDDDDVLPRMVGCHGNEWRAVKAKLIARGKIWTVDGKLTAKRVETELKERKNFSETQRKRAGKRWEKTKNDSDNNTAPMPSMAVPLHPHSQPQPHLQKKNLNFDVSCETGEEAGEQIKPPRQGARSRDGRFVYFKRGTSEFEAYAKDYQEGTGEEPAATSDGRWFKRHGEVVSQILAKQNRGTA